VIYLLPVVAVILGALVLSEPITLQVVARHGRRSGRRRARPAPATTRKPKYCRIDLF
jgi:hypothetical protein